MVLIYILPVIIALIQGKWIVDLLIHHQRSSLSVPVRFFLSLGVGWTVSAQIVCYVLFARGYFDPVLTLWIHLLLFFVLFLYRQRRVYKNFNAMGVYVMVGLIVSPFILNAFHHYQHNPWGQWDSWGLWEFRANFIWRSDEVHDWQNIFQYPILARHPWSLPFMIDWGWLVVGEEHRIVPLMIACVFCIGIVGLLVSSLYQKNSMLLACLAGLLVMAIPFESQHMFSLYADILVAYFLLAVIMCFSQAKISDEIGLFRLGGFLLGCLSFCKDEGVLLALLLVGALMLCMKGYQRYQVCFWMFIGSVATLLVKIAMFNPSNGINQVHVNYLFDLSRWQLVLSEVSQQLLFNPVWSGVWAIIFIFTVISYLRFDHFSKIILGVLCVFLGVLIIQYIVFEHDIVWRISVTFNRIMFIVLPVWVWLLFRSIIEDKKDDVRT